MKCIFIQQKLDESADDRQYSIQARALDDHLQDCAACRAYQQDVTQMRQLFAEQQISGLAPERLEQMLARSHRLSPKNWAIAASLLVASLLGAGMLFQPQQSTAPETALLAPEPVEHVVHLRVRTAADVDRAYFRIELPEGVEIIGHPNQQALEWEDRLMAGSNRLDIPLRINSQPTGPLLAKVNYASGSQEIPVALPTPPITTVL